MVLEYATSAARSNPLILALAMFMVLYALFVYVSPSFAFDRSKRARPFGIGIKSRTVTPVWLVVIVLSILCYLFVIYISNMEAS